MDPCTQLPAMFAMLVMGRKPRWEKYWDDMPPEPPRPSSAPPTVEYDNNDDNDDSSELSDSETMLIYPPTPTIEARNEYLYSLLPPPTIHTFDAPWALGDHVADNHAAVYGVNGMTCLIASNHPNHSLQYHQGLNALTPEYTVHLLENLPHLHDMQRELRKRSSLAHRRRRPAVRVVNSVVFGTMVPYVRADDASSEPRCSHLEARSKTYTGAKVLTARLDVGGRFAWGPNPTKLTRKSFSVRLLIQRQPYMLSVNCSLYLIKSAEIQVY
ncbi:hypothetical protein P280DRAFT_475593 [Massarina eburnea CBS 473.64]|uniref:Uncharacterized protein n=1 Tax=Massarina eburnea CBS 473.64 TaxID=1395130 RepID=A0A6A6SIC8_9PLEO|nr:hypothetical protein P280DRAFT_475593 [Massarina eburnea CBS 473.64]